MEDDHAICSSGLARRLKWSMELSNYVQLGLQPGLPLVLSLQGHVGEIVRGRVYAQLRVVRKSHEPSSRGLNCCRYYIILDSS